MKRMAEWLFLIVGVLYALWELRLFLRELRRRIANRNSPPSARP